MRIPHTANGGCGVYVAEWEWDEDNEEHIARHGVLPAEIEQVRWGKPKFRRNRTSRAATHQMIGPDEGGRVVAVFIVERTTVPGRRRAIAARPATPADP